MNMAKALNDIIIGIWKQHTSDMFIDTGKFAPKTNNVQSLLAEKTVEKIIFFFWIKSYNS